MTTDSNHKKPLAPNVLDRRFNGWAVNRAWTADITYVATGEGWLYLAAVMDLASRKIVGWSMSDRMKADLVCEALRSAYGRRKPAQGLIVHTDRGSQYASKEYRRLIKDYGLIPSMSRKGNCWDTQFIMHPERRTDLTRAGIGQSALALTCRSDPGVPRALPGPAFVT